jgi:hypothetical protein
MQVGLDKLFDSDMNLIITVWRRLELFSTHSFRHEVGIYFHQLFDSVLCLICIFCNIDQKSVDLFQPKIPENSILFKIIIRSWWATKSISKVQSMHCFIVCCAFKLRVDKIFLHFQVMYVVIVRRISETFQTIWSRPLMFASPSRFLQFKQFDYY